MFLFVGALASSCVANISSFLVAFSNTLLLPPPPLPFADVVASIFAVLLAKQEEVFRSPAYLQGILSFLSFVKPSVSYWLEVFFPEESALIAAEQQAGLFFLGDHRGQDPQVLLLCFLEIMFSYMPPGRPSGKSPVSCKDAVPLYRPQLQELVKIHRHLGTFDPGFFVEDLG